MTRDEKITEEKVLEAMKKPRTRIEIADITKLSKKEVTKVVRKLEKNGIVISRGSTAARRHMTLAAAIEVLFRELKHLSLEAKIDTTDPSWI